MAKRYTTRQIEEALTYWKNKLQQLDESEEPIIGEDDGEGEGEDDVAGNEKGTDELEVEKADDPTPFTTWNTSTRLVRAHKFAVKKTIEKLVSKLLNKAKIGEESVKLTNSLIDDDDGTGDFDSGNTMIVTLRVTIDEAHVKGFRKFMAVLLKESTFKELDAAKELNEGIFSTLANAIKAGAKEAGEKAKDSINKANKELEKKIGLAGL